MRLFHSIRAKLTLWYALILAFTLVGFGVTSFLITRSAMYSNLDYSLRNEVKWVNEFIQPRHDAGEPDDFRTRAQYGHYFHGFNVLQDDRTTGPQTTRP